MDHLCHHDIAQHNQQSQAIFDIELDIEPLLSCTFPTSSARNDPPPQRTPRPGLSLFPHDAAASHRYDRLRMFLQEEDAAQRPIALTACTTYPTHVPRLHQVATGVLSDGSFTINHPAVRHFLASAETDSCVTPPSSPPIFALAALAVFYHPKKPAHWIFWSRDMREKTAAIVHKVLNIKPQSIQSPVAWMGIPENLSVVANLQFGWRDYLSNVPWYAPFAVPKSSPFKSRMNLRKRKVPPTQQLENQPTGDTPEDPAADPDPTTPPPRKRPRTRRTAAGRTMATKAPSDVIPGDPEEELKQVRSTTSYPPSRDGSTASPPVDDDVPAPRTSLRQKARKALFAMPASPSTPIKPDSPLPITPRRRSTSCTESTSECSTAVSPCRVRSGSSASASPSDLSAVTAVEIVDGAFVKGEDEGGGLGEEGEGEMKRKGRGRKRKSDAVDSPATPRPPGSRVSARLSAAKEGKRKNEGALAAAAPAQTKARASTTAPNPTNTEDQIVMGRRKGASVSAVSVTAAATKTGAVARSRKRKRARGA